FDQDSERIFPEWRALVEAEAPGLVARLNVTRTPNGYHVRYRCPDISVPGNQKLAVEPYTDPETGKPGRRTLIETRGEGGYALAPGCPPECHPSGRTYEHHSGPPLTELPAITPQAREARLRCPRLWDKDLPPPGDPPSGGGGGGLRPGDDFDRRGPGWAAILEPHGWVDLGGGRWQRPGKEGRGCSATAGYCKNGDGHELLAV